LSRKDSKSDKGVWKLAGQLAKKVTPKQAAIILILLIVVYGFSTFVTGLSPSLSANPNLLVILAVVVIAVCGFIAMRAMALVTEHMPTMKTHDGTSYACQEKGCSKTFRASRPDGAHILNSTDRNIRKNVVERTYTCSDGHANTLYWYDYYDE
jgi:hypothetical protein